MTRLNNETLKTPHMLILTRRNGEKLRIGDEVTVTVLDINGNQVRLGFDAPKSVSVHRQEIYERIEDEKRGKRPADPGAAAEQPNGNKA